MKDRAVETRWDSKGRTHSGKPGVGAASLLTGLLVTSLISPMTVACQTGRTSGEAGMNELRSLVKAADGHPGTEALARFESKYRRTRAGALAQFLRGYLDFSAQNYQQVVESVDAAEIGSRSSLGDYALFLRAESEANVQARGAAVADYRALYIGHPDSLRAREARLRYAEVSIESGDAQSALRENAALADSDDPDALLLTARALEAAGKGDRAREIYHRLYFEFPATVARVQAEARLAELGEAALETTAPIEQLEPRADRLFDAGQYLDAAQAYSVLLTRFPDEEKNDRIQFRLGTSLLRNNQPAQAVSPLSKVSERDSRLFSEALFNQAEALRRSNRAGDSAALVDRLQSKFPGTRWAETGLYNLASSLDKQGRDEEANTRYRQLLALYPSSDYAPEASYNLGWWAYRSRQYAEAARILTRHLGSYRYPKSKYLGEAGFWAARAEERLGHKGRALALFELVAERYRYGYHGYIASRRAGGLESANPGLKPENPTPGSELERIRQNVLYVEPVKETSNGSQDIRVRKADDLETIGLGDMAIRELNKALESAPDSPRLNLRLAQVYSRRGDNFQATLILRRAYPDLYSYKDSDLPREAWEIFFPMVEWDTIKQEAKRYGIDPYLAAGLIRQESVFNPTAISRVGARGLMQLMPATGQLVAKQQGNARISAADLLNPGLNIRLGMNYLAKMVGQFGKIEYAAAAYNAGPGRARRWINERGSLDMEEWIETIPISETRGYVQGILRYAANYRRLYGE